jgi:hypothetical protein
MIASFFGAITGFIINIFQNLMENKRDYIKTKMDGL